MKVLYYDCFAGISGDMNLGALIDLGVDPDYLRKELGKLNIEGFHLEITRDQRRGISGTKAEVVIENPDNEKHRHLRHIEDLIQGSTLSDKVKRDAMKIFDLVAVAEGKVHDIPKEKVHFHEVGALDSIADIVGAAICIDYLKPGRILSSPVQLGGGMVRCAHGLMPVPAPATAEIVRNIPVKTGLTDHEATTPTGAAIIVAMADEFTGTLEYTVRRTGYGIGNRDPEVPNVLRVFLCETTDAPEDVSTEEAILLESNIDDMNPEHYDYILDQLFWAGAKDAWLVPILMKKSRPAATLSVLCQPGNLEKMKEIIFTHSSSIGIREYRVRKDMLRREEIVVETPLGPVRVKQSYFRGRIVQFKPEAEDCRSLAEKHGLSIHEIEKAVIQSIPRS